MISTSIKLDGEAEFKKQLSNVNSSLKATNSEMNYVTEAFKGQANSLEALTEKDRLLRQALDQTNDKISASEEFLEEAQKAQKSFADAIEAAEKKATSQGISLEKLHGDTKKLTDDEKELAKELLNAENAYVKATKAIESTSSTLNKTRIDQIKFNRELEDNSKYLDEARRSADKTAKSIDGFGREVEQVDDQTAGFKNSLTGVIDDLGKLKGAIVGGAAVGAIKELAGGILELEESTREYRTIMGTLAVSGEEAGYTADETAEAYERLQSVLGDPQTAATATANLQAIGLEQEDLMKITDLAIGAWATYGDSIPIDGLAEAINETIQAGTVTGTFADVLNWAGESEDAFNEKLAEAETKTERANIVLQALTEQGLADAANGWFEVNEQIVNANTSEENLRQAWGELGEALAPVADWLRNTLAGAVEWLTEKVDGALEALQELKGWWDTTKNSWNELFDGSGLNKMLDVLDPSRTAEAKAASVTGGLTGAELRERGLQASDIVSAQQAASRTATSAQDALDRRGSFSATITLATEDGRNLGQYVTPFVNEENAANPPVRSDPL